MNEAFQGRYMDEIIRYIKPEDTARILEIYAHYIKNTAITFEYTTPTLQKFKERIINITKRYPYLVIEQNGAIQGFAYANTFIARPAYDHSCEVTIYLDHSRKKHGFGRKLYEALEAELKKMGILNMYACIASPCQEDEYLDRNSIDFHSHLGFEIAGNFHKCGYKFDRWYDMVWMEKIIGAHL